MKSFFGAILNPREPPFYISAFSEETDANLVFKKFEMGKELRTTAVKKDGSIKMLILCQDEDRTPTDKNEFATFLSAEEDFCYGKVFLYSSSMNRRIFKNFVKKQYKDFKNQPALAKKKVSLFLKNMKKSRPKRVRRPYDFFASQVMKNRVANKEAFAQARSAWEALSMEEREQYNAMSEQDSVRFSQEMVAYRKLYPQCPVKPKSARSLYLQRCKDRGVPPTSWKKLENKTEYERLHSKYLNEYEIKMKAYLEFLQSRQIPRDQYEQTSKRRRAPSKTVAQKRKAQKVA